MTLFLVLKNIIGLNLVFDILGGLNMHLSNFIITKQSNQREIYK